MRASKKSNF